MIKPKNVECEMQNVKVGPLYILHSQFCILRFVIEVYNQNQLILTFLFASSSMLYKITEYSAIVP